MKLSTLQLSIAIFIIFFGLSLLESIRGGNWLSVAFWILICAVFLILGGHKKIEGSSH